MAWNNYLGFFNWNKDQALAKSKPAFLIFLVAGGVMATLLHSESRRLYSWWWDSHISPKNSKWKWLQDSPDMDMTVNAMIKLIEEDADCFAGKVEMYYKKRPELTKLVKELYQLYLVLAERYDHVTVKLRHAHKTMAKAFPDQIPFVLDDSASASSESRIPEMPTHIIEVLFDLNSMMKDSPRIWRRNTGSSEESHRGTYRRGLKQLNELIGSDACDAETEIEALKKTLAKLQPEKEALHVQYQLSLHKLLSMENELNNAQNDAGGLDERASEAEIENKILKEALGKLEADWDARLLLYNQSKERISNLEVLIAQAQENKQKLNDRASTAETQAQHLKQELSRLLAGKEAGFLRYKQCLEMISLLEEKIKAVEESARVFNEKTNRAENEIETLKQELSKLNDGKEDVSLRYQQCLETIAKLETEILCAKEDTKKLSSEVVAGAEKLNNMEDRCAFLENSNQSLRLEAGNLEQKIVGKDQELFKTQNDLEKLQTLLQDNHAWFQQLEAGLKNLQNLQSHSEVEQKVLILELQNRLQMLKDLEMRNHNLEDCINQGKEQNQTLIELNNSFTISFQIQQNEISSLKEMKQKLEDEVARHLHESNTLQEEILCLKEEIDEMNRGYQRLMEQLKLVGLNPECIMSSVKKLQDENSKLIELCSNQRDETNALNKQLREMGDILQKNALLESSLLESNSELKGSKEKVKHLQDQCESLKGEKSDLVAERATLLSQLQIMTENMQKLLQKNSVLDNSFSGANVELEGLRDKSKCFEQFFHLLKHEKSVLLKEREALVSQLESVKEKLVVLENMFLRLEEKYADVEKEKWFTEFQVEELRASLVAEKQEHAKFVQSSKPSLVALQSRVSLLQEECWSRKNQFEEELDRAKKAQAEIFILQNVVQDLEQKNFSLLIECQTHVEASKVSEKIILELEKESLEQQFEAESLLNEIENLSSGINQVFKALRLEADHKYRDNKIKKEQITISSILAEIEDLKCSLSSNEDEKQQLVIKNSALLSVLEQIRLDGLKVDLEKNATEKNLYVMMKQNEMLQKDKCELLEANRVLKSEVIKRDQQEKVLRAELESQHVKLGSVQEAYLVFQREYSNALEKSRSLFKKCSELKDEMSLLEEENGVILWEGAALSNIYLVFQCFGSEKADEVEAIAKNVNSLQDINVSLKQKVETLEEKLNTKEAESRKLHEKLEKLHEDLDGAKELNGHLKHQILAKDEILKQKATDLSEAEEMLIATHNANAEMCKAVEELNKEFDETKLRRERVDKQISELFQLSGKQKKEIKHLLDLNENLESKVDFLHTEIEELRVREKYLCSELLCKSKGSGLWDAEATSFYFDLQISAVREVLLENKALELTGTCVNLKDESAAKSMEIEQMKEIVGSLESEIRELKTKLSAYVPVVACLKHDIESLEKSARSLTKLGDQQHAVVCQEPELNKGSTATDEILCLQEMQTRIRNIERLLLEERDTLVTQQNSVTHANAKTPVNKQLNIRSPSNNILLDKVSDISFYGKSRSESCRSNDQMLKLWEVSAEQDCRISSSINSNMKKQGVSHLSCKSEDPSLESQIKKELGVVDMLELSRSTEDKAKILERLMSGSRKLMTLQTIVKDLTKKMEMCKRHGRIHSLDHEKAKRQLKEVEAAVLRLIHTNNTLSKNIKETGLATDTYRERVVKHSLNASERIEQLQFDLQNIEQLKPKLEDGTKTRVRKRFSENRMAILSRGIIHKGETRTGRPGRRKKNRFFGCMRSLAKEESDV